MASHYVKENQRTVDEYIRAGGQWPAKKVELAEWALRNNRWKPSREDILRMCGESLVEAMREEVFEDETGRVVRAKIPAKTTRDGEQGTFWDDVRTAPITHIRIGVTQRRNGIAAECFHLFKIVRYSNDHREAHEQIELVLNFTNDVTELDQPIKAKRPRERAISLLASSELSPPRERSLRVVRESDSRPAPSRPSIRRAARGKPRLDSSSEQEAPRP